MLLAVLLSLIEHKQVFVQVLSPGPSVGHQSVCVSVCLSSGLWKTAEWNWMAFGMVGWLGPGIRQLIGIGNCFMGKDSFGVDMGRPVVTSGDFVAQLCKSV